MNWHRTLLRQRHLLMAAGSFLTIYLLVAAVSANPFSYFQFGGLSTNTCVLALAAMGQTIVFLLKGFDLSAGAALSLVNVIVASQAQDDTASQILVCLEGIAVGGLIGAFNGVFVAYLRLQPVVVTLASMFICLSLSLLIMPIPGGHVAETLNLLATGDLIPGRFPASLAVIIVALLIWLALKRSPWGTALYAVGGNAGAAQASGIAVARTRFLGYFIAGLFYGAAGVFLSAQTGAGDPLVGRDMILLIFGAVILGGGGAGGCLGTVFAAFTLTLIANLLVVLDVSSDYTSIVESVVLILAVIGGALGRRFPLFEQLAAARSWLAGRMSRSAFKPVRRGPISRPSWTVRRGEELPSESWRRWFTLNRESLRLIIPSWSLCLIIYGVLLAMTGTSQSTHYFNSILTLSLFLVVLGLGQGAVMLTGGLDLSVPHTIAFTGVVLAALSFGSDASALWAIPLVLLIGAGIGIANGIGIVAFGIPPLVMTLAMNGIIQGAGLLYTGGMPTGSAPPSLSWLYSARYLGFSPAAYFLILFAIAATLLLHRTVFGRRMMAIGNSLIVARLSGVRTGSTLIGVYALSGFCAALVGILMTGFSGISFLSMGMPYLLPSIAAVLVGGTLATGGRGHYLAILGGAILLTMVGTLVSGAELPIAVRDIVYGLVILGAVLMLRERREVA